MIKRRRFLQCAGLSSFGLLVTFNRPTLASLDRDPGQGQALNLEFFDFEVKTVRANGQQKQPQRHQAQFFAEALSDQERLEMVAIAPGKFWMGESRSEVGRSRYESPRHPVRINPFFLSKYPITQAQWSAVTALPKVNLDLDPAPAYFQGEQRPVENVSWLEAIEFCDRLRQHTGRQYQLPSEAQWEYACRAKTNTPFHTGETITSDLADYIGTYAYKAEAKGQYRRSTTPVGGFSPNAFGLYDMHGNVWEWCADSWHTNYQGAPRDGRPWLASKDHSLKSIRGGSWQNAPDKLRSASRSGYMETALNRLIGFRVSCI